MLYNIILYSIVLSDFSFYITLYCTVLYSILLYCSRMNRTCLYYVPICAVLYCITLWLPHICIVLWPENHAIPYPTPFGSWCSLEGKTGLSVTTRKVLTKPRRWATAMMKMRGNEGFIMFNPWFIFCLSNTNLSWSKHVKGPELFDGNLLWNTQKCHRLDVSIQFHMVLIGGWAIQKATSEVAIIRILPFFHRDSRPIAKP